MTELLDLYVSNFDLYVEPGMIGIFRFVIFAAVSVICIISDLSRKEIPSAALIVISGIVSIANIFIDMTVFLYCLYGTAFSSVVFIIIYFLSRRGIGLGDMFYMIFFSSLYGLFLSVNAVLFGFWIGALILIFPLAMKKISGKTRIPFVPFLFAGGIASLAAATIVKWQV